MRVAAFLIFIFYGLVCSAQVDSLEHVLNGLPQDTLRLPVLKGILRATVFTEPDKALVYAKQYRDLAASSGNVLHLAEGENFIGMCWSVKGEHAQALAQYIEALKGFERAGDRWYASMSHNNIGSVHMDEERLDIAQQEFQAALSGFTALKDTAWQANIANNLANVFRKQGKLDSAFIYYAEAGDALERVKDREHAASARYNQGNISLEQGLYAQGLAYLDRAQELLVGVDDDQTRSMVFTERGLALARMRRFAEAERAMREGLALAVRGGFNKERVDAHLCISELFELEGRHDSALVHMRAMVQWKDSLFSQEKSAQIAEMQEKYESGRKDVELAENRATLERRSLTIKAIAMAAVLLFLSAVFAYRAYRLKRKGQAELERKNTIIQEQLGEKELLVREIHHRVKNNLQTVSSLLSLQERGITDEKAKEAVSDSRLRVKSMALIHQDLYQENDLTGVQMRAYVEKLATSLITSYGMTEHVSFNNEVQDLGLDVDTAVPLGLILNELVTNALKYAWPDGRTGRLTIALQASGSHLLGERDQQVGPQEGERGALILRVVDDGIGYTPQATPSKENTGFGLGMIRTFASKLKAEWSIRNEQGTVVELIVRNFKLAR